MSEKVVLTQKQADAITLWLSRFDDKDALLNSHSKILEDKGSDCGWNWDEEFRSLYDLSVAQLARVLYTGDYEIAEPTPQFEPGDFVVKKDGSDIHNGKLIATYKGENYFGVRFFEDIPGAFIADGLRKANEEEIYWLHELERNYIGEFREGDVIITQEMSYRYSMDGEVDTIGPHTTQLWLDEGIIKGIYPAESFKPFKKESGSNGHQ